MSQIIPDLRTLVEAVLLFHSTQWTQAKRDRWFELTGKRSIDENVLCDLAELVLAKAEAEK